MKLETVEYFIKRASVYIKYGLRRIGDKIQENKELPVQKIPVTSENVFNLIKDFLYKTLGCTNVSYQSHFVNDLDVISVSMIDLAYEIQNKMLPDGYLAFITKNHIEFATVQDMVNAVMSFYASKQFEQMKDNAINQKQK